MLTIFAILILIAYFVVIPNLPDYIRGRIFESESYQNTIDAEENRVAFWRIAFRDIIPNSLPLGVGAGCTVYGFLQYYGHIRGMHNTYINMICEFGILGIPAFLYMLWCIMKAKFTQRKPVELGLLLGIMVIILFLDSYAKKFFWNVIMLLLISESSGLGTKEARTVTPDDSLRQTAPEMEE